MKSGPILLRILPQDLSSLAISRYGVGHDVYILNGNFVGNREIQIVPCQLRVFGTAECLQADLFTVKRICCEKFLFNRVVLCFTSFCNVDVENNGSQIWIYSLLIALYPKIEPTLAFRNDAAAVLK